MGMRLIDADNLDWWYKGRPIRRVIDEAPTVDAVPVVYGRWVAYPDEYQICATEFVCSNCNTSFVNSELASDNDFLEMMKFCPHCGAKMDGGSNAID